MTTAMLLTSSKASFNVPDVINGQGMSLKIEGNRTIIVTLEDGAWRSQNIDNRYR
jgi:hypothetical protein